MQTLIKNGVLATATKTEEADLLIEDDKIISVGQGLTVEDAVEVIDARGLYVLPGGVDVHVHLDLPMFNTVSSDDHYTGTKAAACGGTTTVIDFVSQETDDLLGCVAKLRQKADARVAVDYGLHMNITHLNPRVEEQIPLLVKEGVTSLKVFTAYNGRLRLQDHEIFRVLRIAGEHGLLTMLHAENGDLIELLVQEACLNDRKSPVWHARTRPAWGAVEAVMRGAALAAVAQAPLYIVHINTSGEVDMLRYARDHGVQLMGETCPQYLFFTEDDLARPDGAGWVCSPPLRTAADQQRIWKGLKEKTVQVISTDHCPFFLNGTKPILYEGKEVAIPGKELGRDDFTMIPNGLPGVGDRLPVLWTKMVGSGEFSINEFVALTSTNPARIFGMYPRKGSLSPGADADIVLWDPRLEVVYGVAHAQQRTDYNLYEGWKLTGYPLRVLSRGRTVYCDGTWSGKPGNGKFIHRAAFTGMV
ncbi:MAG TPA: dihydropyrimidinase [Anaerolineaceae bacterium]|jgi:dihydropyrimidinase|nr:dihydropyrimidinase [Chloroflexota bacterium]HNS07035.1 dihydropyrimidinase [Anaerolineaceae bacterium]HOE01971.1 dihydropyrimidinase [Anaerolineaceae bacterium]HOQ69556.1 dihydropyrimidinase [Anaerolineaceae bacterium]HOS53138.1 dihydropyrimidinase [Anaerolineaceae bacterium]